MPFRIQTRFFNTLMLLQQRSNIVYQLFGAKKTCRCQTFLTNRVNVSSLARSLCSNSSEINIKRSHTNNLRSHRFSSSTNKYGDNDSSGKGSVAPSVGQIEAKMQIAYTCKVCSTRNYQTFSKQSYNEGVVIVKCKGCNNHHLIADNLGWFKDIGHRNIEEILASKGETISKITSSDEGSIEMQNKGD